MTRESRERSGSSWCSKPRRATQGPGVPGADQRRLCALPGAGHVPGPGGHRRASMTARYSPAELAGALGLFTPTEEQAAVIAAPPGPLVVIAGAGAGKTETMAARVVWLVANGYARPGEVLGLTFTRKAAGQLLRRVRTRLARLAGAGLVPGGPVIAASPTTRPPSAPTTRSPGTCCASTACCCRSSPTAGCSAKPSCGSWRFASCASTPSTSNTEKTPAAVTAMVLRLAGQLAEHLVDTDQLRDTHVELERLVHTLPAGPYQRDRGPSQWLLRMLATQTERIQLVPLIDALHARMRAEKVMDFGMQMASAARLASTFPQVGAAVAAAATGWCCSTSTRTPGTRSAWRCRRCSAAASTTTSR